MTYKIFLEKYSGKKAHFDLSMEGYYLIDFSGASYSNATVLEAHDEFIILFDEVDKNKLLIPYSKIVIRY